MNKKKNGVGLAPKIKVFTEIAGAVVVNFLFIITMGFFVRGSFLGFIWELVKPDFWWQYWKTLNDGGFINAVLNLQPLRDFVWIYTLIYTVFLGGIVYAMVLYDIYYVKNIIVLIEKLRDVAANISRGIEEAIEETDLGKKKQPAKNTTTRKKSAPKKKDILEVEDTYEEVREQKRIEREEPIDLLNIKPVARKEPVYTKPEPVAPAEPRETVPSGEDLDKLLNPDGDLF